MKKQPLPIADQHLLHKRTLIETIMDQLKNIAQIEHTRHRAIRHNGSKNVIPFPSTSRMVNSCVPQGVACSELCGWITPSR